MSTESCPSCGVVCLRCAGELTGEAAIEEYVRLLIDEMTVALLRPGAPVGAGKGLANRRSAREAAAREIADWGRIEEILREGPVRLREIAVALHGPPNRIVTAAKRDNACVQVLRRLIDRGLVVRVRQGWYALQVRGRRQRSVLGADALLPFLRRERMTAHEISWRFDVLQSTVHHWLKAIEHAGHPLRWDLEPGRTKPRRRWWVERVPKKLGRPRKSTEARAA